MKYFPVYIDLKEKNILVAGTGHESESKIEQLLQTGANLKLIADREPDYINRFIPYKNFYFEQKAFHENDLENIWLVISTLADRRINEFIYNTALAKNILCNVVDVTDLCSFIFPAIVSRGDVNIAISTSGTSPALAQMIKAKIFEIIGPEYGLFASLLGRKRKDILSVFPHKAKRTKLFHNIVNSEAMEYLKQNRIEEAEQYVFKIIENELAEVKQNDIR